MAINMARKNFQHASKSRWKFAAHYAGWHLLSSLIIALTPISWILHSFYPAPYRAMTGVMGIFALILVIHIASGPVLSLFLSNPAKSPRERWIDFSLIGLIQCVALAYGLHSLWVARPVALIFEVDRLVMVSANEIQTEAFTRASINLERLATSGHVLHASVRRNFSTEELLESVELGLAGISTATRPEWWEPWEAGIDEMARHARPLAALIAQRPHESAKLSAAVIETGLDAAQLRYLPLVNHKTLDWIALLDENLRIVGSVPVDGFSKD